jgi:hypothetical protein
MNHNDGNHWYAMVSVVIFMLAHFMQKTPVNPKKVLASGQSLFGFQGGENETLQPAERKEKG